MSVIQITYNIGYTGSPLKIYIYIYHLRSFYSFIYIYLIPIHLMNIISFKSAALYIQLQIKVVCKIISQ